MPGARPREEKGVGILAEPAIAPGGDVMKGAGAGNAILMFANVRLGFDKKEKYVKMQASGDFVASQ